MADVHIPLVGLGGYFRRLGAAMTPAVVRGVQSGALACVPLLHNATRRAPPASPYGARGAFNTGEYLRAWRVSNLADGARVYNDRSYAAVVEWGRRRGGPMPPREAIRRWAQRRLGLSVVEARAAAWPIARAIARRGLRGRRVMEDQTARMTRVVMREARRELREALARAR